MDDFTLTDAAIADKSLQGVPTEQVDDELAKRGYPTAFDNLLKTYRALQQALQQKSPTPPQTTVADDIMGLAALNNQLSSDVQNVISPQAAAGAMPPQDPSQMAAQMSAQMPPQDPSQMEQGLGNLDAGVMQNPQFANGGIIAFANRGAVEGVTDENQETQQPMTYNTYMANQPQAAAPVEDEEQDTQLPTSYAGYMQQLQSDLSGYKKDIAGREERLRNRPIYQAAPDPSLEEDRRRIVAEKLSNEHDIDKDRWQSMVDMGLAWAESAAKGDDPLVSLVAGSKAGTTSLRKINDEYKKTQAALDKELIALDHAKYVAEETQRKSAYDQVYAIEDNIDKLHDTLFSKEADLQAKAVTAAIQHQQATTKSTANPSNYEIQMQIELDALREQNNKLPPDQRLTEAQLRQRASQRAMFNEGQQNRLRQSQQAASDQRYISIETSVRKRAGDPLDVLFGASEDEIQAEIMRQYNNLPSNQSSSSSSAAPTPPAPASSSSASGQPRRISLSQLPSSRG